MNQIPSEIRSKLESLQLKTVRNGSTPSEEESARDMIQKLLTKYDAADAPRIISSDIPWAIIASEYLSPANHKLFKVTGRLTDDLIEKISWDSVAARFLSYKDYDRFYTTTEPHWKEKQKSYNKTLAEIGYRVKCYQAFIHIYK